MSRIRIANALILWVVSTQSILNTGKLWNRPEPAVADLNIYSIRFQWDLNIYSIRFQWDLNIYSIRFQRD